MANSSLGKTWTETRNGRIAVIAGVIGLFLLVFWWAMKSRGMLAATSPLVIDEQNLWFGEVWEDPAYVWTLPIRNTSNEEVEIGTFAADCTCVKIEPQSLTIAPQETKEVRLTIDLRDRRNEPARTVRDLELFVQPRIKKGPSQQSGWKIHGAVKTSISFTPRVADFEDHLVVGEFMKPITVRVKCHSPITRLVVTGDERFVHIRVAKSYKEVDVFLLTIKPSDKIKVSSFTSVAMVQPIAQDGIALPSLPLLITGVVLSDVQLMPSRVLLGARKVGDTVTETISMRSLSKKKLTIDKIYSASNDLTVDSLGKDEEGYHRFRLKLRFTQEGNHQIDVAFLVRDEGQGEIYTILPVSYFGVAPERSKE